MCWDRLCAPKLQGGLSFKRIRDFNLALLGKQAWRLMTNRESSVVRIFKGRYHVNCTFMEALVGHNPSYYWRSIVASQELIREGWARRIRNGKTTIIWKDVWMADQGHQLLAPPPNPELAEAKVSGLMKMNTPSKWDTEILDDLFDLEEKECIMRTPISPDFEDDWYWKLDLKGRYTVKSAYKAIGSQLSQSANIEVDHWAVLWNLKIPEKVRIHWRRIMKGIIPVRKVLKSRGVDLEVVCPLCANQDETIKHLFLDCCKTRGLWQKCNLNITNFDGETNDFESLLMLQDRVTIYKVSAVLWIIWKARNNVVWRGTRWNDSVLGRWLISWKNGRILPCVQRLMLMGSPWLT